MKYDNRLSSRQRGYNSNWEKVRKMKLNADPLCEQCKSRDKVTGAVLVHHINSNPRDNRAANLMSVCRPCHDVLHSSRHGCDINGNPLDPNHPWNLEGGAC
ncbi:HNH endonuclease signature motif containing protein [Desulfonatronovibrio magnus]|uniref:HNH endonuclease signature motif containing protein n=1 Tax=Desulfonatronovibrio magnus TaxID=698827 RepID=UPI000696C973|nr:HNH endonuclease signature motif containing protein [Desulfonatronovibrio magnus]